MKNESGLRELSMEEIEEVSGGFDLDLGGLLNLNVNLGSAVDGLVDGLSSLLGLEGILHQ